MSQITALIFNGQKPLATLYDNSKITLLTNKTKAKNDIVIDVLPNLNPEVQIWDKSVQVENITPYTLYAPTINGPTPWQLDIYNNPNNGEHVAKYYIYDAEGNFIQSVDYVSESQSIKLAPGWYQVTAVDVNGNESRKSNLASPDTCFIQGTPIIMYNGDSKSIEQIEVGDKVSAYDLDTKQYCEGTVTEVIIGYTDRIASIMCKQGDTIIMAEGHPLYTENGWRSLTNKNGYPTLVVGDKVQGPWGNFVEIVDIQVCEVDPTKVYSLTVTAPGVSNLIYFTPISSGSTHGGGSN